MALDLQHELDREALEAASRQIEEDAAIARDFDEIPSPRDRSTPSQAVTITKTRPS